MYWLGDGGVFGSAVLVGVMVIIFVETGLLFPFLPRVGPALFKKDDSRFFKRRYLTSSHEFFERHGPKVLVLVFPSSDSSSATSRSLGTTSSRSSL